MPTEAHDQRRIAVYYAHLGGGGAEQIALAQIEILIAAGYAVDIVLHKAGGHYAQRIPDATKIVTLTPSNENDVRRMRRRALSGHALMRLRMRFVSANRLAELDYLPSFVDYLERARPAIVIANLWSMALVASSARACVDYPLRVVGVFHSAFFREAIHRGSMRRHPWRWRHFFALCRHFYSRADALVTVSDGVGRDLVEIVGVAADRVETLPNPVFSSALKARAVESVEHLWLADDASPLVVAVGRLSPEKNYSLLLHALALVRARGKSVRLAILGTGSEREALEALRRELSLDESVLLPGWVDNPQAWMARATLVALSSNWEGLPTVLIEGLAGGCRIVATDCPHGPREILDHGRFGWLVPVGDAQAMADAIMAALNAPHDPTLQITRANNYSVEAAARRYIALVERLTERC